jgi:hypothetical protein
MSVNQKMFAEIHELITEFPELHEQNNWETDPVHTGNCGTTRCIAGWAAWIGARDHGLLSRKRQMTALPVREALAARLNLSREDTEDSWYYSGCHLSDHALLGGKLLGLDDDQAYSLFHDLNDNRAAARVKSYAETGMDISPEEFEKFDELED